MKILFKKKQYANPLVIFRLPQERKVAAWSACCAHVAMIELGKVR